MYNFFLVSYIQFSKVFTKSSGLAPAEVNLSKLKDVPGSQPLMRTVIYYTEQHLWGHAAQLEPDVCASVCVYVSFIHRDSVSGLSDKQKETRLWQTEQSPWKRATAMTCNWKHTNTQTSELNCFTGSCFNS